MKLKFALTVLLLLAALPLAAQDRNIQLTVFFSRAQMQGSNDFGNGFVTDFDDGTGYGASANMLFGRYFSVEGSIFSIRSEGALILDSQPVFNLGNMSLTPISLGVQFHPLAQSR